jgi:PAS domain S-box-containing protein
MAGIAAGPSAAEPAGAEGAGRLGGYLGPIADCVRDIMLLVRRDGQLLDANAAAVAAYGHGRAALLCMNIRALRAAETMPELAEQMAQAEAGGALFETIHRRADGSTFPVEVSSTGAEFAGERVLLSVIRDISERRRAERALAEGAARLEMTLDAGGMGRWEVDLRSGVRWRDPRTLALCGLPPATPADAGAAFDALIHPDDRPAREEALRHALAGDGEYRCEFRIRRADTGEERWLAARGQVLREADGAPSRLIGVNFDVTERRRAEQALHDNEARLRIALEAARMSTWDYDLRAGLATRSGNLVGTRPGLPRERFTLAAWLGQIHPEDQEALARAVAGAASGQVPRFAVEYRLRRAEEEGGGWMWMATHGAVAERDAATGEVLRLAGIGMDVSARKAAEERQRLLMREVDHRAKNALAVVQAALRLTPRDHVHAYAEAVEGRVRALARAHSLLAEGQWSGADLRSLAAGELAPFLGAPERPGGAPRAVLEGPRTHLGAEAAQGVSMILHELATNAVKHGALSAPGGRVRLAWGADLAAATLRLDWVEEGGPETGAPPARRGFGWRIIEATTLGQLGGTIEWQWEGGGLRCTVAIPLARALGEAARRGAAEGVGTGPA